MKKMLRIVMLAVAGAGASALSAVAQEQQPDIGALMKALMDTSANQQAAVELIPFRDLKAQLPEDLPDMKRVSASGEKTGAFGMSVSFSEAEYRNEAGGTVRIKITDSGGMGGLGAMAQAGFSMSEIDRETETGYEKTTTHKSYRALEKFDSRYETGSITLMAEQRLTFEVEGRKVEMDVVKGALDALDMEAIVGLIPKAGEEEAEPAAEE